MVYQLTVITARPDQLVLGFGLGWRCFFGALGVLLAYAMIQEGHFSIFASVITVILFLAAFYFQRWEFDRRSAIIVHSSGLLFFVHRTRRYSLTDLQEVLVRGPVSSGGESRAPRGGFSPRQGRRRDHGFTRLWLRFAKAGAVEVQMDSNRNAEALRELGTDIARFCAVPYRDEGPA